MLEKSFGLFFFLKKPKIENGDGTFYVYLKITVDGDSREISTKRLWHPSKWSKDGGCASGKEENSKSLNSFLDTYKEKAYQAKKMLLDNDRDITAQAMKVILTGKGEERKMIIELFQYHNDQMQAWNCNFFITEYSFWFKSIRNCNQNKTAKYLGNFKKIVFECVKKMAAKRFFRRI